MAEYTQYCDRSIVTYSKIDVNTVTNINMVKMFRLTNNLRTLNISIQPFVPTNANLQTLRWRRKPLWMPTAKSKIFRVPPRPVVPPEEAEELKRLNNNYRTQMKSIRRYLINEYVAQLEQTTDPGLQVLEFEEDFARCSELNNQWNSEIKKQREERSLKELEESIQIAKERLAARAQSDKAKLEEADQLVREQKRVAATFITRENVIEAIEKAIANPVDHNFAIDANGNKIFGRETVPEENKAPISVKQ